MPNNQHVYGTFSLTFSLMTPIYNPEPVIYLSTGWYCMLFFKEENGIYVYCYYAMNDMTDFYSINILWSREKHAMQGTVDALFSRGLNI